MKSHTRDSFLIVMAGGHIDDHNLLKKAMSESGMNHVFTSVYNGRQLLDYLGVTGSYASDQVIEPDLLILDVQLRLVSGFEVLKYLRDHPKFKELPVYVLTNKKHSEDERMLRNFNIEDFIEKPRELKGWKKIVTGMCRSAEKSGKRNS